MSIPTRPDQPRSSVSQVTIPLDGSSTDPLQGLDEFDWAAVSHAYAHHPLATPRAIRALVMGTDVEASDADLYLGLSVVHQGSIYSATPVAVRFLAQGVLNHQWRHRPLAITSLADMVECAQSTLDHAAAGSDESRWSLQVVDLGLRAARQMVPEIATQDGRQLLALSSLLALYPGLAAETEQPIRGRLMNPPDADCCLGLLVMLVAHGRAQQSDYEQLRRLERQDVVDDVLGLLAEALDPEASRVELVKGLIMFAARGSPLPESSQSQCDRRFSPETELRRQP